MNENNKETQMQEASESETYAVDFRGGLDDGVELYSSYGGAVSSLYVDYFRGFVSKLPPGCHYFFYRDSQYSYTMYFSVDIQKSGNVISGYAPFYRLTLSNNYNNDIRFSTGMENFSENITTGMYYSDFSGLPDLRTGGYYETLSLIFTLCFIFLFALLFIMFRLPKHYRLR